MVNSGMAMWRKSKLGAQSHEAGGDEDEGEDTPLHDVHFHHEPVGRIPSGAQVRADEVFDGLEHA